MRWLLFFPLTLALAQTTGTFEGVVLDPSGAAIKGASVSLVETLTGARRDIVTADNGYYVAPGLAPGVYEIQVSSSGFRPVTRRGLVLDAGRSLRIDFPLQLGQASQGIVVTAEAPLVSIEAADWGSSVTEARLDQLPLNGRDLFDLSAQEPSVTVPYAQERSILYGGSLHVSVNGNRPGQNSYRMDGIFVNDAAGAAPSSASGQTLGIEAVQELRLANSPFLAEYGRAAGAMFTAVSKSGSNDFHGSLYEFFRNSTMDAKNFFDPQTQPIPPLKRNQFGGLLSGPLRHNRLFFLGNYEAVRSASSQTSIATTLGAQARLGQLPTGTVTVSPAVVPFLKLFPLPNGALFSDGTGQFIAPLATPSHEDYVTGKVDYLPSEKWRFSTRYTFDRGGTSTPDPFLLWNFDNASQYQFAQIQLQNTPSAVTLDNLYVGFSRVVNLTSVAQTAAIPAGVSFVPGSTMGAMTVTGLTALGGQSFRSLPTDYITNDFQVNYEISHTHGAHTLKAGVGFDRVQLNEDAQEDPLGYYVFSSVTNLLKGLPSSGSLQVPGLTQVRGWRQNLYFAYVQDEIRITRRLEVTLGLRYEPYSTPNEVNGLVASLPDPLHDATTTVGGSLFRNPSKTNFAPRAALAWDLFGDGRTVFRAGAGIFYDPISTSDLTFSGSRMPPFYNRVTPTSPPFPDLALTLGTNAPLAINGMQYYENQPYVIQFQAAVEHQFGANTAVRIGYAGSHGLHLPGYVGDVNITTPSTLADGQTYFAPGAPLLNPNLGTVDMRLTQFPSSANALQAQAQRRFNHGFRAEAKYSWSKVIDESSNPIVNEYLDSDYMPSPLNFRMNRGPANFDIGQTFAADWSWQTRRFLGGWAFHGILQAQTGPPFNPITGFDRTNLQDHTSNELGQRPNYTPLSSQPVITGNPAQWFNPNAFTLQPAGTYGNLGRDTLAGPGLINLDAAVHKVLWTRERASLILRVEMFNVANHPNFQIPSSLSLFGSTGARVASAGQITQTTTSSRQLQLALKATF